MNQPKTVYSEDLNKDGSISKLEAFPYWIDKLRIFPRAFITVYIYMFYNVVNGSWLWKIPIWHKLA